MGYHLEESAPAISFRVDGADLLDSLLGRTFAADNETV